MHSLLEESGRWTRCHHIHRRCRTALPGAPTSKGVLPKAWYCTLKDEITSYTRITYSSKKHSSCQVCWAVKLLNFTDQVHGIYIHTHTHTHSLTHKNSNNIFLGWRLHQEVPTCQWFRARHLSPLPGYWFGSTPCLNTWKDCQPRKIVLTV